MDKKETIIVNGENVEVNNQKFKLVTNPNARKKLQTFDFLH